MPELIREVLDPDDQRPLGWLVIDTTVRGRSHGGLRISPSTSREEMMVLARKMTLKFGFLGLASGGAKAGIIGDPETGPEIRQKWLLAFARALRPLVKSRQFLPHADMGTSEPEIRNAFGLVQRETSREESGNFTAIGVSTAALVAAKRRGWQLENLSAAIEGFGKVGTAVAQRLSELGVRVVAISTSRGALYKKEGLSVKDLAKRAVAVGSGFVEDYREAERITGDQLLALPVSLLCPCSVSSTINVTNAQRIRAELICAGANAPVTPEAEIMLQKQGTQVLPDFLTNAGGVLGGTMLFAGITLDRIPTLMAEYLEPRYAALFEKDLSAVEQYCLLRHANVKHAAEQGGLGQKLFGAGLGLYRAGLIPKFLVSRLAEQYFLSR